MPDCPFCSLGDTPLVYESELVVAFRDRFPVTEGHTLVIPRRHVATYFDANAFEQGELWRAVEHVKRDLDAGSAPDGYNVGFNAGQAAGQTVMHLHIHVIPRRHGDMDDPRGGVRGVIPTRQKYDADARNDGRDVPGGGASRDAGSTGGADATRRAGASRDAGSTDRASVVGAGRFGDLPALVAGQEQHFVRALRAALTRADRADLLAAFVQPSGLALLAGDIADAARRGAQIRVLTGDYMGVTSADALRALLGG